MIDFSRITRLYVYLTWAVGIILLTWQIQFLILDIPQQIIFLGVILGASFAQIYKIEGTTNRSHYAVGFTFYAFSMILLGVPATLIVIIVSNLAEWVFHRPPWYITLFNIAVYIVSIEAAHNVYGLINPSGSLQTWMSVAAILAGMLTFTLLNHLMVGGIIWLARDENFSVSGVFDLMPLMVDLTMLVIGASLNLVWNYNPYAVLLFIIPLYLIYSTLRVPALERKVDLDSKTGIFNNEYFMHQFQNELPRANRFDRPLTVIMADLDLLRNINNTYGHLAGDEVIKGVAHIIQLSVREYDIVSRFGGEEFGILMPETSLEVGYARAEMIRRAVEKAEINILTSSTPIKATISLGVACRENFQQTKEEILQNADAALFHSKLKGRNCTHAYSEIAYDGINLTRKGDNKEEAESGGSDETNANYKAAFATFQPQNPASKTQTSEDNLKNSIEQKS